MFARWLGLAAGLALGAALSGASAKSVTWKSVGDWDIAVDTTIDNGCYALASWSGGTMLRIGRNPQKDNFYMLIGNDNWASLEPGESYPIQIRFGGRAKWDVLSVGLQFAPGEPVYLHAQSAQMEFIAEFQRALNMRISYNGSEIDNLKLTGSRRAWDEVEACQAEVAARGTPAPDDPFAASGARPGRQPADPFASN